VAAQTLCPSVISTNPLIGQSTPSEIEQDLLNQQLQKALIILKDDGDREIVAWLQLARCVERFGHCCYRDEGLSADKVQAIATLKDCAVNDVCTWLKECRALCT